MREARALCSSLYYMTNNVIYVFGGYNEGQDLASCEKFSLFENKWKQIAPMNKKKHGAASFHFKKTGHIYVFGGNNTQEGPFSLIEKYSISQNTWSIINYRLPMPIHDF
mmetsp:Transcript_20096/g.19062  ORF Transcript_20096/g.19062 Transcript_20096/m.19062 type:complete len:109 (-) Transcript_20096:406-732(-)